MNEGTRSSDRILQMMQEMEIFELQDPRLDFQRTQKIYRQVWRG